MKGKMSLCSVFLMIFIIICSCATSVLKSVWNDSTYEGGPFKKVLVMGVDRNPNIQKMLEDGFVGRLTTQGAVAVAGHTLFPADEMPDRETVMRKIHELGIDSVLITTVVDVKDVGIYETYPPQFISGLYDYYVLCCQSAVSEGYTVMIEAKIFDAHYNKVIWSTSSESAFRSSVEPAIYSFISLVIKDLHDKKLLQ